MRAIPESDLLSFSSISLEEEGGLPAPMLSTVEEVMARDVIAVHPDTSLRTAAELMLEHGISGMPVVDEEGQLVGMLSKTDVVRHKLADDEAATVAQLPSGQHFDDGSIVEDVMTQQVLAVREGASISEAAQIMVNACVHRVPVLTARGALAGLLSTSDIVRWVAGLP